MDKPNRESHLLFNLSFVFDLGNASFSQDAVLQGSFFYVQNQDGDVIDDLFSLVLLIVALKYQFQVLSGG